MTPHLHRCSEIRNSMPVPRTRALRVPRNPIYLLFSFERHSQILCLFFQHGEKRSRSGCSFQRRLFIDQLRSVFRCFLRWRSTYPWSYILFRRKRHKLVAFRFILSFSESLEIFFHSFDEFYIGNILVIHSKRFHFVIDNKMAIELRAELRIGINKPVAVVFNKV